MELNLDKTEIIVLRNGGYLRNYEIWTFKGEIIKTTSMYKYMGILFTPRLSWTSANTKLAAQAQIYVCVWVDTPTVCSNSLRCILVRFE